MAELGRTPDSDLRRLLSDLLSAELSRRHFIAAGGLGLAAVLVGCQTTSPVGTPGPVPKVSKYPNINLGLPDLGTQTPDPMFAYSHGAMRTPIFTSLGEMLVRRDLRGQHSNALAESYQTSPDGLTWTFTLRSGVKMHDGSTFTAQDVKTAIDRVTAFPGDFVLNEPAVQAITKVDIIDDLHIALTTSAPYVTMLDDLPVPIPTGYYKQVGDAQFRVHPMAAGPFKFVSQQLNVNMVYERFDGFWDPTRVPNFKTLTLILLPEESSRLAGLQSGSLDAIASISPAGRKQLQGASGIRVITNHDVTLVWMIFAALNPDSPTPAKLASPVHDLRVRQAMLYGMDRQGMINAIFAGAATLDDDFSVGGTLGHNTANKPYPFNAGKAKQLLKDAGHASFNFTLVSKNADDTIGNIQDLGQAIASNWNDIGINTTYQPMDPALQGELQDSHVFDGAFLFGLEGLQLYDPGYLANQFFLATSGNVTNGDPKLNEYAIKLSTSYDPTARAAVAREYDDYLYATQPAFGLFTLDAFYAIGPHVSEWNLQDGNGQAGPFWELRGS
jgi:peptide/nickel transport system substrate-binding protein